MLRSICLVMIVRNEAAVIERCIDSVKPYINCWVICDTGSTDKTREIIRGRLRDIPGDLYEDEWVNFGHNRTLAIQRAAGRAEYHLLMNADETLTVREEFRDALVQDAYMVGLSGESDYYVPALVSDRHKWRYVGVTHEHIWSDTALTRSKLTKVSLKHHFDGGSRADKFTRDIRLLSQGIQDEPENSRYMFYLAETYRAVGLMAQAIEWYQKRVRAGGWHEEVFYSLYQLARIKQESTLPWPVVLDSYLAAWQFRPSRLEPLLPVARFYRESEEYQLGYLFSRPAVETPYPDDILFVHRSVYEYELPLEYALCCERLGKREQATRVLGEIIAREGVPSAILQLASDAMERCRKR